MKYEQGIFLRERKEGDGLAQRKGGRRAVRKAGTA